MPEAWHMVLRQKPCRCGPTPARLSHLPVPKTKAIGLAPSSVQDGIYEVRTSYMRSTASLGSFLSAAMESVSKFVWLTMWMSPSRSFKEDRLALLLSTPLSSRRSMVWCLWFCARAFCLKRPNTSDLPRSKPLVVTALPKIKRVCYLVLGLYRPVNRICPNGHLRTIHTFKILLHKFKAQVTSLCN